MDLGKSQILDLLSLRLCQDLKKEMFISLAQMSGKEKKYWLGSQEQEGGSEGK